MFRCEVLKCYTQKQPMYHFKTSNEIIMQKWLQAVGKPDLYLLNKRTLSKRVVCSKHFEHKFFINVGTRLSLTRDAYPTLDLELNDISEGYQRYKEIYTSQSEMSVCCVKTCFAPVAPFFNFKTSNPTICRKWLEIIGNKEFFHLGLKLLSTRKVCSRHFEPQDITMRGCIATLRKTAIPTLHLNDGCVMDGYNIYKNSLEEQAVVQVQQGKSFATEDDCIVQYAMLDEHAEIPPTEDLTVQDALHDEHDLTVEKASQDSSRCANQMKNQMSCANRNTVEKDTRPPAKKQKTHEVLVNRDQEYCILNFITVFTAISLFVNCKECQKDVKFSKTGALGLGFQITLECDCGVRYINSCTQINNVFEINHRIVFAMRLLGVALNGLNLFCGIMDLGIGFASNIYYDCLELMKTASQAVYDLSTYSAIKEEINLNAASKYPLRLFVSSDGTWEKRGRASVFGVTTLTGRNSGKIVDAVVKVNYCAECIVWSTKHISLQSRERHNNHKRTCTVEFTNKINGDSIKEMFRRSKIKNGVLYTKYVKTFKPITDLDFSDYEIPVEKNVCVSHAEKFMAAKLHSVQKIVSDGRNFTDELIDDLATCYGLAIKGNMHSLKDMKRAVWADILHKISTNEHPRHDNCPIGPESWCKWRQAEANGTLDMYKHEAPLNEEVVKVIWPIYESLSSDQLLTRCLSTYTWYNNHPLKAMIWAFAPKHLHASQATIDLATMLAVCIFNDGLVNILNIMQTMGITIGLHAAKLPETLDIRNQRSGHAPAAREGMLAQNDIFEVEEDPLYGLGAIH